MTKRDLVFASIRHHHARFLKYYPRRHCAPSLIKSGFFPHTTNFYLQYLLSYILKFLICIYTRGILGCLLGFWPLGQNPAGAIKNKCYQFFFSKSFKCSLCLFLLNSVLISQKQCTGFCFHSSSALNNKDLIILTFITIAG